MFQNLADKLEAVFKGLKNKGRLTEKDIDATLKDVKLALLEADVNFKVVKDFTAAVRAKALGQDVLGSLTPSQQVIRIVHGEMAALLGGARAELIRAAIPPTRVMLAGLQGSGKTTTAGKLALALKREGRRPYLIPADLARPAAVEQLLAAAARWDLPAYPSRADEDPVSLVRKAVLEGVRQGCDILILDTAGRLHADPVMMAAASRLASAFQPHETLLVADAMTGQEAVKVALAFHKALGLTGLVLTKMDGDARGGAALSMRAVTGVPIKFAGTGEGAEALEAFHPERTASRILGMGDVLTLIERAGMARQEGDEEAGRRALEGEADLADFRDQIRRLSGMGSLGEILEMLPLPARLKKSFAGEADEAEMARFTAIIDSMTPLERKRPSLINGSRRKRIAAGSGTTPAHVNRLLKRFEEARRMMKALGGRMGQGGRSPLPF